MRSQTKTNHSRISLVLLAVFLSGCGITEPMRKSEAKLSSLDIGQSKSETRLVLGNPDRVRASRKLEDGRRFELHEYDIFHKRMGLYNGLMCPLTLTLSCWIPLHKDSTPYWLQYIDGKLEKWGRAGDWQADVTGDITIRSRP